eukprot:CAMPEP_0204915988 /NCGR_PEP_ID=MMETSP1397-20131031/13901_1 /ASSEMBLY_ACC=CAM_ASM_000891 /TAXON_ID=49980 /ORGANISM="Climacostomum Climacostomum virens, Strain Stock W-24" /LENGTH=222 /DNA_ID=CAMNT_0052088289 /DNA_START=190 /DNA_END=855 /DNA_ORIENTATION=-
MADVALWTVFLASFFGGGFAGCAVDLALFPIDAIKTRLQASSGKKQINWGNLYSGLLSSLTASFPCAANFWVTYTLMKLAIDFLAIEPFPGFKHLVSAATSSVTTAYVRSPFEVVKQNMQVGQHKSTIDTIKKVYQAHGFQGFYVGALGSAVRDVPFDIIQFCIYELLKSQALPIPHVFYGALAGSVAALLTTPIDVAKTKMTVECSRKEFASLSETLSYIW